MAEVAAVRVGGCVREMGGGGYVCVRERERELARAENERAREREE
jgi:hypothetical protein